MIVWLILVACTLGFVYFATYSVSDEFERDEDSENFVPFSSDDKEFEKK